MITSREYYGWAQSQTLPAMPTELKLNPRFARLWRLRAGVAGMHVKLLDPTVPWRRMRAGVWHLVVWNDGVNSFDVQRSDGTVLCSVAPAEVARIDLASSAPSAWATTFADLHWRARIRETVS